jgi:hypothetical protein
MHLQQILLQVASKLLKLLVAALTLIALAILGFSCSPAKRVLKENDNTDILKQKYQEERQRIAAEAVADFVKNNPCEPVPWINLDSLCSIYYPCPDTALSLQITDHPSLITDHRSLAQPKTILVPFTDKRALQLLKDSCSEKDKRIATMVALLQSSKAVATVTIQDGLKTKNTWLWFFIVISIIEAAALILIAKK